MISAPKPFDESLRLEELHRLDVLDTPSEPEFNDFVELARMITGAPIVLISLVDAERQWFKSCIGLTASETPRAVSFCAHAILESGVMWIEDARRDVRFADNPLVAGDPKIRFYAGAPIVVADSKIGTLCVIDTETRPWDQGVADQLAKLAKIVGDRLEARRQLREHSKAADAAVDAVLQADRDGTVTVCNLAAAALLGRPAAEIVGRPLNRLFPAAGSEEQAREDRQYRLLVGEVDDYAIYLLDAKGRVATWNAGARRIKGYEPSEIIGQHFSRFYTDEDQAADTPKRALRKARATGRFEDEGWRVRKDGTPLWASVVITALYDEGRFIGFAKITRDITERHDKDAALKIALQHAEDANQAKSAFLANMSHEIRTPLNGVVGVADVLLRSGLDAEQREMAEIISASAQNLEHLLGDILDLSRIEAGHVSIDPEPFDLIEMVTAVAGLARLKAQESGLRFDLQMEIDPNTRVVGDKLRIQQILTNLLSNAVKFTPAGKVSLEVKLEDDVDGWATGVFEVRDTGVGFDPTRKDLIFDRFSQADGTITRRFGGTGLGMAISQQLAQMMNAELACDSVLGQGSMFRLVVPLGRCERVAPAIEPCLQLGALVLAEERPIRILLADDHPTNRKVCELILAQIGAEVTSVENGALAVETFQSGDFDVILMDMQMPVMDGLTAVREIRAQERAAGLIRTPIFMLTANALPEHVEQSRAAGADHHISKPVTSSSLFAALALLDEAEDSRAEKVPAVG